MLASEPAQHNDEKVQSVLGRATRHATFCRSRRAQSGGLKRRVCGISFINATGVGPREVRAIVSSILSKESHTKTVVADDSAVIRTLSSPGIDPVAEAVDGAEAIVKLGEGGFNLVPSTGTSPARSAWTSI